MLAEKHFYPFANVSAVQLERRHDEPVTAASASGRDDGRDRDNETRRG
jgi:hypothetical protein